MFNELIETEPQGADIKDRKKYFILSSLALGSTLFVALIVSLFAVDLNLGMGDMDMLELIAPIEEVTEQKLPEPDEFRKPKLNGGSSQKASRQVNMARLDESPREVPTVVSTVQNTAKARPAIADFKLGNSDDEHVGNGSGRGDGTGTGDGDGLGEGTVAAVEEEAVVPPPPVKKEAPVKEKPVIRSMGVVNSYATSLPKPAIPAAAKVVNAAGTVSVQVLIDERGNVVSATAVSGNQLLRASSEAAARNARFTPTLLSGTPVKISGVINYHFASQSAD